METPHVSTAEGTGILLWVLWIFIGLLGAATVWLLHQFYDSFKEHKEETKASLAGVKNHMADIETKLNDNIVSVSVKMNQALGEVQKAAHSMKVDSVTIRASADKFETKVTHEIEDIKRVADETRAIVVRNRDAAERIEAKTTESHARIVQIIQAVVNFKKRIDGHDEDFKTVKVAINENLIMVKNKKKKTDDTDEG